MAPYVQRILQVLVAIAFVLVSFSSMLEASDRESARCEAAIAQGARDTGVPQEVLHAISLTETGRKENGRLRPWPWAINREGQGYWFKTREEAMHFARTSLAEGRKSFDVGCFQINYRWHGHNFTSLEAMFDPVTGARYAGTFLRDLYAESGDWSRAAGSYHSRTPHFANIYRTRFDRIRSGLGTTLLATAMPEDEAKPLAPRKSRTRLTRAPLIIDVRAVLAEARGAREELSAETRQQAASGPAIRAVPEAMRTASSSDRMPGNGRVALLDEWVPASSAPSPETAPKVVPGPNDLPQSF